MVEALGIAALALVLFALGCYCGIKLALYDLGDDCPESSDPDKETPPPGWDDHDREPVVLIGGDRT